MKTEHIPIDEKNIDPAAVRRAAQILKDGGVVAVPTETVYGLAADAMNEDAVRRIFAAKDRPADNPLIVHITRWEMLDGLAEDIPEAARRLAERFWPGPLTMVLKKGSRVPDVTSAGLPSVGIRMPSHPVIRAIIDESGLPLAAPSANRSGRPSTTTAQHCIDDLDGRVDAIVCSGECSVGVESTVLSLVTDPPRLLRPGAVTPEQLCEVIGEIELDPAVTGPADVNSRVSAPGMKYRHYAPLARVQLVRASAEAFAAYVNERADEGTAALCFAGEEHLLHVPAQLLGSNENEAAHVLFAALREFDRKGVQTVYVHCPDPTGVGLAVFNRLQRAAAFDVIEL